MTLRGGKLGSGGVGGGGVAPAAGNQVCPFSIPGLAGDGIQVAQSAGENLCVLGVLGENLLSSGPLPW